MSKSCPRERPASGARDRLRKCYDKLWSEAIGRISAGRVELDPVLEARLPDERRGLTVIARPSHLVRYRVEMFLRELQHLEHDQYYYAPAELHLTVLSLFTARVDHEPFFDRTEEYMSAVDSVLRAVPQLAIKFKGITASPSTVIIQGFPANETLNEVREKLRRELRAGGLAEGLDERYRLESAHMTVLRFRAPLRDPEKFATALQQARERSFGTATVKSLSLVQNDWCTSRHATVKLKLYHLAPSK